MNKKKERIQPEFEWSYESHESVRYQAHDNPGALVRWDYHRDYKLHLINATSGKVFAGDYMGSFAPGSLILIGPNLSHNWVSQLAKNRQMVQRDQVIQFSPDLIQNCEFAVQEMRALSSFWECAQYGIEFLDVDDISRAAALFEQIAASSGLQRFIYFLTLIELLATMKQYRILSSFSAVPIKDEKILYQLNQAVKFIFERYDSKLTLDKVADYIEMSPTYFSKFFKKSTGQGFTEFVNGLRIHKACERLAYTNQRVTDICFSVGFNNIANFNRRFSDLKKMTPLEYRKTSMNNMYK